MRGLKTLRVYDAAVMFSGAVGRVLRTNRVPLRDEEQLRRASKSIGDNIAEGHGYGEGRNRLRFYRIARGSAQECLNQLRGLRADERISATEFNALFNRGRTIVRMLTELIGD